MTFILLHDEAPLARHAIAFRFWPDVPEKKARNNLRQLLYRLRESLPRPERFLNSEGSTVGWRSDAPATVDVHRFESGLGGATTVSEVEEALALYGGPLLPDHYDEWLLSHRERLQQEFISGLERLATMLGVEVKDVFWLMGRYDALLIVEAPDDVVASRVSLFSASQGNGVTETMRAFSIDEFREIVKGLP